MSENLRINQYSYADICNMIISANHPADLDAICKEAYEYIETKIASYLNDTSQIELFSHEDVDICEKLIIFSFSPFDAINNLYVIFDALNKQGYKVLYGTLGQAIDESIVTDGMSAYAEFLYAVLIIHEENLHKICDGLPDEHREIHKNIFYTVFDHYKLIANRLNIFKPAEKSETKAEVKNNSIPSRENLRINRYSHAEMWKKLGAAKKIGKGVSPEINDICKEAYDYIHNKTSVYLNDTSKSEIFDHEDVDICERLIIFGYNVDNIAYRLHSIFEALKKRGHNGFYGSLGKAVEDGRITRETTYYFKAILESLLSESALTNAVLPESHLDDDVKKMLTKTLDDAIDYYRTISDYIYEKTSQSAPAEKKPTSLTETQKKWIRQLDSLTDALAMSNGDMAPELKTEAAELLIEMAEKTGDDSRAVELYEYAAWFNNARKRHSEKIAKGIYNRLEKAGCLTPMYYTGGVSSKMSDIQGIFHNAPEKKVNARDKAKYIALAVLCLIIAAVVQFTPLKELLQNEMIGLVFSAGIPLVCGISLYFSSERYERSYTDFGAGILIGGIIGVILMGIYFILSRFIPIIAVAAAVFFLGIAFFSKSKATKDFDKYMEENNFRAKAEEAIKYIECAAAPFEEMDSCSGLDDILSYYHSAIAEVKSYLNQL